MGLTFLVFLAFSGVGEAAFAAFFFDSFSGVASIAAAFFLVGAFFGGAALSASSSSCPSAYLNTVEEAHLNTSEAHSLCLGGAVLLL